MILRGTCFGFAETKAAEEAAELPLYKASGCAVRRTGLGRVMRDAADTWDISLPLNWHSNCDVAHEANCDKETKDSGSGDKLHIKCDSVSAGTTMRCMSIAYRIWRAAENSQSQKASKFYRNSSFADSLYSPIVARP